jgi:AraC-like DNA-binding protein
MCPHPLLQNFSVVSGSSPARGEIEVEATPGVTILVHECTKPRGDWSPAQLLDFHGLVLVRRGGFKLRLEGHEEFIGPSTAFFEGLGAEYQIQHPNDDGDTTTMVKFSEEAALRLTGDAQFPAHPLLTEGWIDFAHRRLIANLRRGMDSFEAEEGVARLVGVLIEVAAPGRMTSRRPSTETRHRHIVDLVREAVAVDPVNSNLAHVASLAGRSVFHVSRIFQRHTGTSLSRYRNSVRTTVALQRIEEGETDLAGLATQLGFTDQAHMTHVIRARVGLTPARIRRILRASN